MKIWHKIFSKRRYPSTKYHRNRDIKPIQGLPDSISIDTLSEICQLYLNEPLRTVSYLHLSGWKQSGAFRLFLRTKRNRKWTLIFKNAIYDVNHIPALANLPVMPGPPGYLIYKYSEGSLVNYLPKVYLAREIIPDRHYQFLLEDLDKDFFMVRGKQEIFATVRKLPQIHIALQDWAEKVNQDRLIRYDRNFFVSCEAYAQKILERYVQTTSSEIGIRVSKLWPQICKMRASLEFETLPTGVAIHGDLNTSNIHISKNDLNNIKLVDWEWAGLGLPLMDLASLLKRTKPEIEQQALAIYSKNIDNSPPFDKQERFYYWCKLERGILDASFIAVQLLDSQNTSMFSLEKFVEGSLHQVLTAYQKLTA